MPRRDRLSRARGRSSSWVPVHSQDHILTACDQGRRRSSLLANQRHESSDFPVTHEQDAATSTDTRQRSRSPCEISQAPSFGPPPRAQHRWRRGRDVRPEISEIARLILASAARLFRRQGYSATTLRQIAGAAKIEAGSIYYYFDSKEAILDEVLDRGLRHVFVYPNGAAKFAMMGDLLGRLHALPYDETAARPGGASGEDPSREGTPRQDLLAALSFLDAVDTKVPAAGRERFEQLRDQVRSADDGHGLPEGLLHGNLLHAPDHAVLGEQGLVAINWKASGRGPRLADFAYLIWGTGSWHPRRPNQEWIDAAVNAYRRHIEPTDDELDRLEAVMYIRTLYLACFGYRRALTNGLQRVGLHRTARVLQLHRSGSPSRVPPVGRRCGQGTTVVRRGRVVRRSSRERARGGPGGHR